jgi:PadR family transcriptional regulator PadR
MPTEPPAAATPRHFLRACLLLLLREQPAHGYELLDRLSSFGYDRSDPGAIYRALRVLEAEGLVHSAWEPSDSGPDRRIYELTRSGMESLHGQAQALSAAGQVIGTFLSRYEEFVTLRKDHHRTGRAQPRRR